MKRFSALIDESITCSDCDIDLTEREDFEPMFRLDTETGETSHVQVCYACIADIERVRAEDTAAALDVPAGTLAYRALTLRVQALHDPVIPAQCISVLVECAGVEE